MIFRRKNLLQLHKPVRRLFVIQIRAVPTACRITEPQHFGRVRTVHSKGFPKFLPEGNHFRRNGLLRPKDCAVSEGCGNRHKLSGCIPEQNFAAASVIGFRFVLIVRMACKHGVHPLKQGKIFLLRGKHIVQLPGGKQPVRLCQLLLFLQAGRRLRQGLRIIQTEAVLLRPGLFLLFLPGSKTVEQDAGLGGKGCSLQPFHRFRLGPHKLRMGFRKSQKQLHRRLDLILLSA